MILLKLHIIIYIAQSHLVLHIICTQILSLSQYQLTMLYSSTGTLSSISIQYQQILTYCLEFWALDYWAGRCLSQTIEGLVQ
jgi:hypothetical protein